MKKCYNCGKPLNELPKKERTREHIPAKALFVDYPEEYKKQRITVPACLVCNKAYAKIDDDLRDLIGILNDNDTNKIGLTKNSIIKILSNKKLRSEKIRLDNDNIFFSFNPIVLNDLHKKNFKGIYTKLTNKPLSDKYVVDIYADGQDEGKLNLGFEFLTALENLGNWSVSGHSDIFKFKLAYFDINSRTLEEFNKNIEEHTILVCGMEYNVSIMAVVIALNVEKWKLQ